MHKVTCPDCSYDKWQYWVIYGEKSEYKCMQCAAKIAHKPEYKYEWTTYFIWDNFPKDRKPSRGVYPYEVY